MAPPRRSGGRGSPLGVRLDQKSFADFLHACDEAESGTKQEIKTTFFRVGEIVRKGARTRMLPKHRPTAAGFQTVVYPRRVSVEQSLPKTTGQHGKWGGWQVRHALLPSMRASESRVVAEFERATDRIVDRFNRGR